MKKKENVILLLIIMIMGVITGCGTDPASIQKNFLEMLKEPASDETVEEAAAYLDKHLTKLDDAYASDMVVQFEDYVLSQDFLSGIDYTKWAARFEKNISPALTKLYGRKAYEQNYPITEDTILNVSWAELAQRAYQMETLIAAYPEDESIKEDALWMYGNYLSIMLIGTIGTPVFDYKTHEFSKEAKAEYESFFLQHEESVTGWVVKEYFTYLESIGNTMDYNDTTSSKLFFDTCDWLVSEAGKRVYQ